MPDSVTVRIEFGAACPNHGAPEFAKLARALPSLFPDSRVAVMPYQMTEYFNHFRVHVDCYLIFDSYTRYPPVMEVAKCVWTFLHNAKPNEIAHSRGIPFSYWRCPEHDGKLQPRQEGACAARHSFIRSAESGKLVGFSVGRSSSSKTV